MRKSLIYIIFAIAAMAAAGSCKGTSGVGTETEDSLFFDSINVDTLYRLSEDTAGPRCHLKMCLAYAKGKNAQAINDSIIGSKIFIDEYFNTGNRSMTVQEAVDSFTTHYIEQYKDDYAELYKADKAWGAWYNCEYLVNTAITRTNDAYYLYTATVYAYSGGAHGSSFTIIKNIDAKTGKVMTLKDIFVPGYENQLNRLITERLCEMNEVKTLQQLRDKTIFMGMEVYPSANFIIGEKDIEFVYSPDEIACHAMGEVRVKISRKEMENLFKR